MTLLLSSGATAVHASSPGGADLLVRGAGGHWAVRPAGLAALAQAVGLAAALGQHLNALGGNIRLIVCRSRHVGGEAGCVRGAAVGRGAGAAVGALLAAALQSQSADRVPMLGHKQVYGTSATTLHIIWVPAPLAADAWGCLPRVRGRSGRLSPRRCSRAPWCCTRPG